MCSGLEKTHPFDQVGNVANALNQAGGYQGFTDWRVPSIDELRSLVYCSNTGQIGIEKWSWCGASGLEFESPTIEKVAFPNTPRVRFWSGSPDANNSSSGWFVSFDNGLAGSTYGGRSFNGPVRLVRGGQ